MLPSTRKRERGKERGTAKFTDMSDVVEIWDHIWPLMTCDDKNLLACKIDLFEVLHMHMRVTNCQVFYGSTCQCLSITVIRLLYNCAMWAFYWCFLVACTFRF